MKQVTELLTEDVVLGDVEAHLDDTLVKGHVQAVTKRLRLPKHVITLTPSDAGTKDFAPHTTIVRDGGRIAEGRACAKILGFQTFAQLYAPDGNVAQHVNELAPTVAEWIRHYNINLLLSSRLLHDHPDHVATGMVALRAAQIVAAEDGRDIGILEVHPSFGQQGDYLAKAGPESRHVLHHAAAKNVSQFRYSPPHQAINSYIDVAPNLTLHPEDHDELAFYPIETDATYTFVQVGSLAVARTAELAAL
jgi:LmbE family N-acetylglucosaminyl deacetylase